MKEKGVVESEIVTRERTESESSNHSTHSNPEDRLSDRKILLPEKEDFIVKVNVATEFKELRKQMEGLQHIKRIKAIKAKNDCEKKAKKPVKVVDESDNLHQQPEQVPMMKTKLTKTRSLPNTNLKDGHGKHPSHLIQRKTSKKKSSQRPIFDSNASLKVENR